MKFYNFVQNKSIEVMIIIVKQKFDFLKKCFIMITNFNLSAIYLTSSLVSSLSDHNDIRCLNVCKRMI